MNPNRIQNVVLYRLALVQALGSKCVKCGSTKDLEVDHKVPIAEGGSNDVDNLQVLCFGCHWAKTRDEGHGGRPRTSSRDIGPITRVKGKTTCAVCGNPATGPYRYPAHSSDGSTYYYTRYAHYSRGKLSFCHVKVKAKLANKAKERKEKPEKPAGMDARLAALEPLLEAVELKGQMPKPSLHMKGDCKCLMKHSTWAHAHTGRKISHRGWICFSDNGLNRPTKSVIHTLAHELAHLRYPARAHRSRIFKQGTEAFYETLLKVYSQKVRTEKSLPPSPPLHQA